MEDQRACAGSCAGQRQWSVAAGGCVLRTGLRPGGRRLTLMALGSHQARQPLKARTGSTRVGAQSDAQ